jgi:hypothetical protein
MRKRLLLLLLVLVLILAAVVPVYADCEAGESPCHPDHPPGFKDNPGDGKISNHAIPPGYAGADAPGPLTPND